MESLGLGKCLAIAGQKKHEVGRKGGRKGLTAGKGIHSLTGGSTV